MVRKLRPGYLSDEEYTAKMKIEHPEYFDRDGSWLPTALTGAVGPGGVRILTGEVVRDLDKHKKFIIPQGWVPSIAEPVPRIQCTKVTIFGEQCKNKAILGGVVCGKHGGAKVETQQNAQEIIKHARDRLVGISDSAVTVYEEILTPGSGANDSIRLKAASDVLDRVGIKGGADVQVNIGVVNYSEVIASKLDKLGKINLNEIEAEVVVIEETDDYSDK